MKIGIMCYKKMEEYVEHVVLLETTNLLLMETGQFGNSYFFTNMNSLILNTTIVLFTESFHKSFFLKNPIIFVFHSNHLALSVSSKLILFVAFFVLCIPFGHCMYKYIATST